MKRKVTLNELVDNGLLNEGDIIFHHLFHKHKISGRISAEGTIILENGINKKTPSEAAKYLVSYDVNGWTWWNVKKNGETCTLDALRRIYFKEF